MQDRKVRSDQWNPEGQIIQEIIDKYNDGKSARRLGFEYDVADVTITSLLKRQGIFIRNRSNAKRTNQIHEDIFDTITEESAYWIGFLLADGNVYHPPRRSKQLNLGLAAKDWDHLEKFKKFVGSNKSLYYNKNGVFLSIYSNRIVEKLSEYGIVPRKSKIAKIPESLKNNRHFWRGMVDGDGWVTRHCANDRPVIGLCGTHDMVDGFQKFLQIVWHDYKRHAISVKPHSSYCFEMSVCGKWAIKIIRLLYDSCSVSLDRKCNVIGV